MRMATVAANGLPFCSLLCRSRASRRRRVSRVPAIFTQFLQLAHSSHTYDQYLRSLEHSLATSDEDCEFVSRAFAYMTRHPFPPVRPLPTSWRRVPLREHSATSKLNRVDNDMTPSRFIVTKKCVQLVNERSLTLMQFTTVCDERACAAEHGFVAILNHRACVLHEDVMRRHNVKFMSSSDNCENIFALASVLPERFCAVCTRAAMGASTASLSAVPNESVNVVLVRLTLVSGDVVDVLAYVRARANVVVCRTRINVESVFTLSKDCHVHADGSVHDGATECGERHGAKCEHAR